MTTTRTGEVWWFANIPRRDEPARGEVEAITPAQWQSSLVGLYAADAGPAARLVHAKRCADPAPNASSSRPPASTAARPRLLGHDAPSGSGCPRRSSNASTAAGVVQRRDALPLGDDGGQQVGRADGPEMAGTASKLAVTSGRTSDAGCLSGWANLTAGGTVVCAERFASVSALQRPRNWAFLASLVTRTG